MPSKTAKQAKLMRAAAHNPKVAKSSGVPSTVAREFVRADEAKVGKKVGKNPTTK